MNAPKLAWKDYEKTLDKTIELLEIPKETHNKHGFEWQTNKVYFPDEKLVLKGKDYPNLRVLYAIACGLKEVELDLPSLEILWINDNQLENFDYTKLPNLRILVVSNNRIKDLEFINIFCEKLETLWVNNNHLGELDISGMSKLENLNCSWNTPSFRIIKRTDKDTGKIVEWKTWETMNSLKLDGCVSLKRLDADMNAFDDLSFTQNLPALEWISLRENKVKRYLDTSKNSTKSDSYLYEEPEETETVIFNSPNLETVEILNSNIKEVINKSKAKTEVIDNKTDEGLWSASEDAPTKYEQKVYEEQQKKEKEAFEKGEHVYRGQTHLDLSNRDYINSITIDGNDNYPHSLVSINLGGNYLSEVIVRNLPNLRRLIISHNKVDNLVIKNCPQLKLIYDYKSGDEDRTPPLDAKEYNEKENPIKQKEEKEKQEKERINKFIKDLLMLIEDIENDANQGDWKSVQEKLTKLKDWIKLYSDYINEEIQERINKLEQRLLTQNITSNKNIWPVIIGCIAILPLTLGIFVWLAKEWITADLNQKKKKHTNFKC
ncbi:MAG: hypothetical protein GBAus27B_000092 [Mycoplasmataceae bacterium]|nr:MAG: hypothetical protein GBAus27B_000092 [Mycoplasmataceae bacterium]